MIKSLTSSPPSADHQLHFYTLPALDRIPPEVIRPIRGVDMFAVDYLHLRKPPADVSAPLRAAEPVPFCVIKGAKISLYTLRERLQHIKVCFTSVRQGIL